MKFYFETLLDLHKSCKDSAEGLLTPTPTSNFLCFQCLTSCGTPVKIIDTLLLTKNPQFIYVSLIFSRGFFQRVTYRIAHHTQLSCLLRLLLAVTVLQTFLVLPIPVQVHCSHILQNFLSQALPDVFLLIILWLNSFWKKTTGLNAIFIISYQGCTLLK